MSMSNGSHKDAAAAERLSALADGELESSLIASSLAQWRNDEEARRDWHAMHLIGDVLRSGELATEPARDEAFLQRLRARMADEPVVLAPEPVAIPQPEALPQKLVAAGGGGRRWSWVAPSAVAAGFVLVAGALLVTRAPDTPALAGGEQLAVNAAPAGVAPSPELMQAGAALTGAAVPVSTLGPESSALTGEPTLVLDGRLIRDARLDRYLAAHQQFAGSTVLTMPAGALRSTSAEAASSGR
jgi:sigma-E factor negative regulatory protein RseA